MPFDIFSPLSWETQGFMFHVSKLMSFCHLHFNCLVNGLISCYRLMALAFWWTWSLLIPFEQIWLFHMLFHLMLGDHNDCGSYIERTILYDWHPTHAFLIFFINVLTWHGEQKASRPCSIDQFYSTLLYSTLLYSTLRALCRQKALVALQRLYVSFILRCVIIVCEGSCRLITFSGFLPFHFFFLIWFLWLVRDLEHHLFLFPLGDSLLILLFKIRLGVLSLFFLSPFAINK
jgi:hypothetical protein